MDTAIQLNIQQCGITHDRVIGTKHPNDGRDWDCQCARCGSSIEWVDCEHCGGDGFDGHDCGEDTCCCAWPEDNMVCDICEGEGGWLVCLSPAEWCEEHPLSGREEIKRSTPQWFALIEELKKS